MKMSRAVAVFLVVAAVLGCCSCGTSSGVWGGSNARKATLAFTATSTESVTAPINGIDITVLLPQGVSVATAGSGSEQIANDALAASATMSGTNLTAGSYAASTGKTRLSLITSGGSYRGGEFLRLDCNLANAVMTPDGLTGLPVTVVKAVGYDAASRSTVTLTDKVKVTVKVL